MPACASLRDEVVACLGDRFGVPPVVLDGLLFQEEKGEVWAATTSLPAGLSSVRPSGLRAFRRTGSGLKPTSAFLSLLGDSITTSRVELAEMGELRQLLLGKALPSPASPGFVAISFCGDVLGCGVVQGGTVRALIPTGRRKELLDALASVREA